MAAGSSASEAPVRGVSGDLAATGKSGCSPNSLEPRRIRPPWDILDEDPALEPVPALSEMTLSSATAPWLSGGSQRGHNLAMSGLSVIKQAQTMAMLTSMHVQMEMLM